MATYQVKGASSLVGVSASSIRAWCGTFAEFLSATANPGPDQPRVFTEQDVGVFQRIQELRTIHNLTYEQISDRLRKEGTAQLQPFIDATAQPPAPAPAPQQPTVTQESPQAQLTAVELFQGIMSHTTALQARMDAIQARVDAQEKDRAGRVTLFAVGVLVGLFVAAILIGAAWLMK